MSRRCRGCGHVLRRPSPDGLGPVCRARLAGTPNPTPRTVPSAPAAGQLELEEPMTAMNNLGADQAATIRTAARELGEITNLADTSALREIFYDLGEAFTDLAPAIASLNAAFAAGSDGATADMPSLLDLHNLVAGLKHCANNL